MCKVKCECDVDSPLQRSMCRFVCVMLVCVLVIKCVSKIKCECDVCLLGVSVCVLGVSVCMLDVCVCVFECTWCKCVYV